ncbi:PepSY domain-containing protein [Oceanobacillus manasiensis]|uniref:PepSY domain-containing protein n=1 Tax=Oceanobacillus manasiensis TaxID=586413 RepID=UPI000693B1A6|nr:PepSY domain-containing protein [Oceanobacillus manasiensis]
MMKKKVGLLIGSVAGAAILGFGVYQSSADAKDPKLNTEEIQQMVTEQYSGTITELELEKDATRTVYEVEVTDTENEIDLKLDASSGEVLSEKSKKVDLEDDRDDVEITTKDVQKGEFITVKEAISISKEQFDGEVREVELDEDDGRVVYEIELIKDRKEADFEIDAVTGEVLELDIDTEDDDD